MKYELVFLLSPKLSEEDAKKEAKTLQEKMEKKGATIERDDFWGRRKLAYEIKHLAHAYYVLVIFEAENNAANEIGAMFNIEKEVLRHLIIAYEGETTVSLKEEEKDEEKIVPQKEEVASKKAPEKKEVAKKKEKKKEEATDEKKEDVKPEELDQKLDEILDKI